MWCIFDNYFQSLHYNSLHYNQCLCVSPVIVKNSWETDEKYSKILYNVDAITLVRTDRIKNTINIYRENVTAFEVMYSYAHLNWKSLYLGCIYEAMVIR